MPRPLHDLNHLTTHVFSIRIFEIDEIFADQHRASPVSNTRQRSWDRQIITLVLPVRIVTWVSAARLGTTKPTSSASASKTERILLASLDHASYTRRPPRLKCIMRQGIPALGGRAIRPLRPLAGRGRGPAASVAGRVRWALPHFVAGLPHLTPTLSAPRGGEGEAKSGAGAQGQADSSKFGPFGVSTGIVQRARPIVAQLLRREPDDGFDEFLEAVGLATEARDVFPIRPPGL